MEAKATATRSKTVQAIRVESVARLMLRGWHRRKILDWIDRESGWNVSTRTVDRLIARASIVLAKEAATSLNLAAEFQVARARIEMLFTAALDTSDDKRPDLRTALLCQRELNRLLGLEAARPERPKDEDAITFDVIGAADGGADDDQGGECD